MEEDARSQYENLCAISDQVYDAALMFEVARRKVYKHLGWLYQLELPGRGDAKSQFV